MPSPTDTSTTVSLRALAQMLGIEPPASDVEIRGLGTIEDAGPHELTFLANDRYAPKLKTSRAGAALVAADFDGDVSMPLLRTKHPRLAFAKVLEHFNPRKRRTPGIHPTAIVPESCTLGADVFIGAYVVLGERVTLGDRCVLHPHCVIYDDTTLGDDCEIHSHAVLREAIHVGHRVLVQNGAILGSDGFGFEPDAQGRLVRVPQVGTVEIQDDVDVQANACIDRSALGATVIGHGTKIDNLAQIAHGCVIGHDSVICGQAGLAGSTVIGNHVMLGGQVGSGGHLVIGDGAQVAAQGGIMTDLEPGQQYAGTPAFPLKDALRAAIFLPHLPDMSRRIKKLERALEKLGPSA